MLDNPTKKTISGEDLAIAIQFSMQFPENRALAFSTGIPLDSTDAELNHVLKRMSDAADTLDASYRLRAMRKYEEVLIHEVHTNRQQIANYEEQAAVAFEASGRKGPLTPDQEQRLRDRLRAGPTDAGGVCTLRGQDARRILEAEFGVPRSLQAVYGLLHRLGFEPLRPRHPRSDPRAQAAFKKSSPAWSPTWRPPAPASGSRSGSRTRPGSASRAR